MTKVEFRNWLQTRLTESDCREEHGDAWREIESENLLPEGVRLAVDHVEHDLIFGLEDGLLASSFETGAEGETIWFFVEDDADANLRDYSVGDADAALGCTRAAVLDLERLLAG